LQYEWKQYERKKLLIVIDPEPHPSGDCLEDKKAKVQRALICGEKFDPTLGCMSKVWKICNHAPEGMASTQA
jgi:hypothetical protein